MAEIKPLTLDCATVFCSSAQCFIPPRGGKSSASPAGIPATVEYCYAPGKVIIATACGCGSFH